MKCAWKPKSSQAPWMQKCTCFFHPDCTVGFGIAPNPAKKLADLWPSAHHRRWGIAPRPETDNICISAISIAFSRLVVNRYFPRRWKFFWCVFFYSASLAICGGGAIPRPVTLFRPFFTSKDTAANKENRRPKWDACLKIQRLFVDLDDNAGAYGAATLTDSETQTFLNSDGGDQLNIHLHVIARHAHLTPSGRATTPVTSVVLK